MAVVVLDCNQLNVQDMDHQTEEVLVGTAVIHGHRKMEVSPFFGLAVEIW